MDSRTRVIKTLRFESPDRAPRDLWYLPGIEMFRQDELNALLERFPVDLIRPPAPYAPARRASGTPGLVGTYTDEWGCLWEVGEPGVIGEVKNAPLADWSALAGFDAPYETLDGGGFAAVNAFCDGESRFVLAASGIRPFERMQFLRGTEALFMDLADGADEVLRLRDLVHQFFLQELARWCETDVDGIGFLDDWGAQRGMLISPALWRALFKPLYADYCRLIHDAGKFAFMHSDGDIRAIYPDLIEIGVDALNSQLFCMDIEDLGRHYRGQITFWGEIDRQYVLPFGTDADVRAAVGRVRSALDDGRGGLFAQCEWGLDVSRAQVEAVFEAWL
ncbi:MAG: methyltransferase [Chloroflexi bacterium]|nr:methyltransferase [Chloroflexota bacterium]